MFQYSTICDKLHTVFEPNINKDRNKII